MISTRMKELRETLGLSMPAFGRKLGCSRDVIANIEYGRVVPKEVFLQHVCDIYGVNPQWLFSGEGPMLDREAGDETAQEAAAVFRSLSPDLRELALSQMKSLQKLMAKKAAAGTDGASEGPDTIRLMAAMLNAEEFGAPRESLPVGGRIRELMMEKGLSPRHLAEACALAEEEVQQILASGQGLRRDALIAVCLTLTLDVEEAQRLLAASGSPALYARSRRDAACIFALMKGLGLRELNGLLEELEEPLL